MDIAAGTICTVAYPFILAKYWSEEDGDCLTWRPGVGHRACGPEDAEAYANGLGKMVLTVVSVHKPGSFPTRVFYTRKFISPDDHSFGKRKLRMTTLAAFNRRSRGFMHPFVIDENEREAA